MKPSVADLGIYLPKTNVEERTDSLILHTYICNATGNNCSDSSNTKAIISLPQNSIVKSVHATDPDDRALSWTQCNANIEVKLSWLCPDTTSIPTRCDRIVVVVERSKFPHPRCQAAFGVFVTSGMPDPLPNNNHWWWRTECDSLNAPKPAITRVDG
ncbi:MAG: hypothetical protein JNM62_13455 [Flavobacteriales bacterium]|nr:hypothetical protein [Flavobacteriales bacterium]